MPDEEPIEPDSIEYLPDVVRDDRESPQWEGGGVEYRTVSGDGGCCPGCGCLILIALVLFISTTGNLLVGLVVIAIAAWSAAYMLRVMGVSRHSTLYISLLVPLFLVLLNIATFVIRGTMYPWKHLLVTTLVIYAVLWLAKLSGGSKEGR